MKKLHVTTVQHLKTLGRLCAVWGLMLLFNSPIIAADFTSQAAGDWNNAATWTITSGTDADGIPDVDDNVTIAHDVAQGIFESAEIVKIMTGATLTTNGGVSSGLLENNGHLIIYGFPNAFEINDYSGNGMITIGGTLQINTIGGLNYRNAIFNFTANTQCYIYGSINFIGTTPQTINNFGRLETVNVNNPNNLTIQLSCAIQHLNFISGKLILPVNAFVEFDEISYVTGQNANRYIQTESSGYGGVRKLMFRTEEVEFPIGASDYTPFFAHVNGENVHLTATVKDDLDPARPLTGTSYVKKEWSIYSQVNSIASGGTSSLVVDPPYIKFQWNNTPTDEGVGFNTTNARLMKYDDNFEKWVALPVANSTFACASGICTVTQTDVDIRGIYTIASPSAFFPVSITGLNATYCKNAAAVTLAGLPTGGVFTIDGNVVTTLDPSLLSVGNHTVVYTASENDYSNSATQIVTITQPTVAIVGLNPTVCQQSGAAVSGTPVGGTLTLDGNTIVTFYPSGTSLGNHTMAYSYTDANGCSNSVSQSFSVITTAVAITGLNATYCQSAAPVTLTGTPTGGTFSVDFINSTTLDPSVLSVGNHTVTYAATGPNGCHNSTGQFVAITAAPTASITGLAATHCQGGNSIVLTGQPTGGQFKIDGNNAIIMNPSVLSVGNHTVTYSVAQNGCTSTATQTVTIEQAAAATFLDLNNIYCRNSSLVTIHASPSGGTYTINGLPATLNDGISTFTVIDPPILGVGNHIVTYTATLNGCTYTATKTIAVVAPATGSFVNLKDNYCRNEITDPLVAIPSGGVFTRGGDPMSFPVITAIDTKNALGLLPPTYPVFYSYMDANACSNRIEKFITLNENPSFTITTNPCSGQQTVTITPTGNINGFTYSINGGTTFVASNVFTNVAAGTYSVVVKNTTTTCTAEQSLVVTTPPAVLSATYVVTNTTCSNSSDGKIAVTVSGGTSPFDISISNSTHQASPLFQNVAAGTYHLVVIDANGCIFSNPSPVVGSPTPVVLTLTSTTNILCGGSATGRIIVAATGGTGAKQYSKDNGTTWQTSATFNNLTVGVYTILSKDANNCLSNTVSATLTELPPLVVTVSKTNLTCNTSTDGTITISATGGTSPNSFSINNGATYFLSNAFTGLNAGNYNVRVKDANNCVSANQVTTISRPAVPTFTTTQTNVTCNGLSNGAISFVVSSGGGGGAGTFQYSIDNGANWHNSPTANAFQNLAIGAYNTKIRNANNCESAVRIVTITEPLAVNLTITSSTNILCNGGATGSIVALATGGTGTKRYSKDGGTTWQNSATFANLTAGTYQVVSKDANNCLSNVQSVVLTQPSAPLSFAVTKTATSCNATADGTINVAATGGTTPYNYSINNGVAYVPTSSFSNLAAATYNVRVKDANNCLAATQPTVVTQPNVVNASTTVTNLTCNGSNDGKITMSNPTGGTGAPYQFSKDNGTTWQTGLIFNGLTSGIYNVRIKDASGCLSALKVLTVTEPAAISFGVITQDATCGSNNGIIVVNQVSGGTPNYRYSKNGGNAFQGNNNFFNLAAGSYPIQVRDSRNCLSAIQNVTILSGCIVQPFVNTGSNNGIVEATNGKPMKNDYNFLLAPNPAQSDFLIHYKLAEDTDLTMDLLDMNGRSVWSKKLDNAFEGSEKVNVRDLPSGVYLVKLSPLGGEIKVQRLVITK
jgi:hypothetical protein